MPALRGRTVVNLFYENSTRTRISFELAAKRLSADVINFTTSGSSVSKGESLQGHGADPPGDGRGRHRDPPLVLRRLPYTRSQWVHASVLNAGDGTHEHPTQALLDLFTIREHFGVLRGPAGRHRRRRPPLPGGPLADLWR